MAKAKANKKKKRWPIILVVVLLLLVIIGASGDSEDPAADVTGTPSASVPVSTPPSTPEPSEEISPTPTAEPSKEEPMVFELVAGEAGEYGELFTMNKDTDCEETYYIYHIPAGTYTVTNSGKYMAGLFIYSDEIVVNSSGWQEHAETLFGEVLDIEGSVTVTIPDGYLIEIHEPARFIFELTDVSPEPSQEPSSEPTSSADPEPSEEPDPEPSEPAGRDYVLNTSTKKFHYPSCNSVDKMKEKNKAYYTGTRDELIAKGYDPCGNCHP